MVIPMNKVSIRDANLPLFVDNFVEAFAGCQITSLINFFLEYNQVTLDEAFRDMTTFIILINLLRMMTLP